MWKGFFEEGWITHYACSNDLKTPYDAFYSSFSVNWMSCKKYGKYFTFDTLCDLLIKDQQKLIEEGKLGGKNQAHFLRGKVKPNLKECGQ